MPQNPPQKKEINYGFEETPFFAFFTFRNEHNIVTVIIQMFLLFAGFVVIVGVVYVILLIILIFVHHILFDRDPHRIPNYVKNSIQFSSDEESTDEVPLTEYEEDGDHHKHGHHDGRSIAAKDDEEFFGYRGGPTAQKKAQIMDKFMTDLDHTRKMKQIQHQEEPRL